MPSALHGKERLAMRCVPEIAITNFAPTAFGARNKIVTRLMIIAMPGAEQHPDMIWLKLAPVKQLLDATRPPALPAMGIWRHPLHPAKQPAPVPVIVGADMVVQAQHAFLLAMPQRLAEILAPTADWLMARLRPTANAGWTAI